MRKLVGVVALLAAFVSAMADEGPAPANFESHRALKPVTFDVKDGNYDSENVPIDCATNAIWLKAHFTRLGKPTTHWSPLMSLTIESVGTRAVIQIITDNFLPPLQLVVLTLNLKDKNDIEKTGLYTTFDLTTPVPVLASWSADGVVTFDIGGETRSVNLKGPVLQASLIGSTSAGVFDPLETGRLAGTVPAAECTKPASHR